MLICEHCVKQLAISYNFKRHSEETDAKLREILKNPNIEFLKIDRSIYDEEYEISFKVEFDKNMNDQDLDCDIFKQEIVFDSDIQENTVIDHDIIIEENLMTDKFAKQNELVCEICLKSFNNCSDFDFELHRTFCSEKNYKKCKIEKIYSCKECSEIFKTIEEYTDHKRTHKKLHSCRICSKTFRSSHGLSYHLSIHSGIKKYKCPYENCLGEFIIRQALEKHICVHHSKKENYLCYVCGKTYTTPDALYYHIKAHEGKRPHLCVHCGQTFKQTSHLKSHMWIHTGIKPYECENCGKCYTRYPPLKKHLKKCCDSV